MTDINLIANGKADRRECRNGLNDKPSSIAARPATSNSAAALKLITRSRGATIAELAAATGWQPHSVRAHLSGLRKKGTVLLRETRKTGEGAYRVVNADGGYSALTARKGGPADTAGIADTAGADLVATTAA